LLANVPDFDARTLVALDDSGSMNDCPLAIGSLFAAVLAKANANASGAATGTVMVFSTDVEFVALDRRDSTLTLARQIAGYAPRGGTNFHTIFQRAQCAGDRGGGGE
jgi:60 kDa SS-A/Ro ribonucleoprotein